MTTGTEIDADLRPVLPLTAEVNAAGHLAIGGCDAVELAREFGTPLYVFDEADLRDRCREYVREFSARLPDVGVLYASKAYIGKALAQLLADEGLGLDVVSGGELAIARVAEFPLDRVYFHGNNKGREELAEAVAAGIGRVVIDNFRDIELLDEVAREAGVRQPVLLRVTPDVDPHTHSHITTGVLDSKFGFALAEGQAEEAMKRALAAPNLDVVGVHCHIGSQLFETEPYAAAIEKTLAFAADMRRHGLNLREFSPGGGIGIQYTRHEGPPPLATFAETIATAIKGACARLGLEIPRVTVEPGRSIVGRAGVALYSVGSRKDVPGVRTYVAVDGGMADNIRPAIYDAKYEALAAGRPLAALEELVTVVGKYCESGDVLVRDVRLPHLEAGEVLAIPASGAYCLSMASNYNAALKPPIVFVRDGKARLVRRRETYADLLATEVD
ncbi:MAG TPA: diaminopimelate decarboxylase [Dehalococcoidia bacterium]|nr:diaminopimelate decarboxylase [Dehalococcoidia bacterium]